MKIIILPNLRKKIKESLITVLKLGGTAIINESFFGKSRANAAEWRVRIAKLVGGSLVVEIAGFTVTEIGNLADLRFRLRGDDTDLKLTFILPKEILVFPTATWMKEEVEGKSSSRRIKVSVYGLNSEITRFIKRTPSAIENLLINEFELSFEELIDAYVAWKEDRG